MLCKTLSLSKPICLLYCAVLNWRYTTIRLPRLERKAGLSSSCFDALIASHVLTNAHSVLYRDTSHSRSLPLSQSFCVPSYPFRSSKSRVLSMEADPTGLNIEKHNGMESSPPRRMRLALKQSTVRQNIARESDCIHRSACACMTFSLPPLLSAVRPSVTRMLGEMDKVADHSTPFCSHATMQPMTHSYTSMTFRTFRKKSIHTSCTTDARHRMIE